MSSFCANMACGYRERAGLTWATSMCGKWPTPTPSRHPPTNSSRHPPPPPIRIAASYNANPSSIYILSHKVRPSPLSCTPLSHTVLIVDYPRWRPQLLKVIVQLILAGPPAEGRRGHALHITTTHGNGVTLQNLDIGHLKQQVKTFKYQLFLWPLLNPYSAGNVFSHQNLTSTDWRLKSINVYDDSKCKKTLWSPRFIQKFFSALRG